MRVKGQSSQAKGQGASVSADEISRIMGMPAVTALLCPSDYREGARVTPGKGDGGRGGVGTDRVNEGCLKERLEMCLLS